MRGQGTAASASIEGQSITVPTGFITLRPAQAGTFVAKGTVTGAGGAGQCEATYTVKDQTPPPQTPGCNLVAVPTVLKLGESVSLELTSVGSVTSATIDGQTVPVPVGKRIVTPLSTGTRTAVGAVSGPAGSASCQTTYQVNDGQAPPSDTPNFAVVPSYCGSNAVPESGVRRVCISVLKRDWDHRDLIVSMAVLLEFSDGSKEVMPLFHRRTLAKEPGDPVTKEELLFYANGFIQGPGYPVLDTRKATLTSSSAGVPIALEGRSASGKYFLVDRLDSRR